MQSGPYYSDFFPTVAAAVEKVNTRHEYTIIHFQDMIEQHSV